MPYKVNGNGMNNSYQHDGEPTAIRTQYLICLYK